MCSFISLHRTLISIDIIWCLSFKSLELLIGGQVYNQHWCRWVETCHAHRGLLYTYPWQISHSILCTLLTMIYWCYLGGDLQLANVYELTGMESCHMLLLTQETALLVKCLMARIASHVQWDNTRMRSTRQNASLVAVRWQQPILVPSPKKSASVSRSYFTMNVLGEINYGVKFVIAAIRLC